MLYLLIRYVAFIMELKRIQLWFSMLHFVFLPSLIKTCDTGNQMLANKCCFHVYTAGFIKTEKVIVWLVATSMVLSA